MGRGTVAIWTGCFQTSSLHWECPVVPSPVMLRSIVRVLLGAGLLGSLVLAGWAYQSGRLSTFDSVLNGAAKNLSKPLSQETVPIASPQIQKLIDDAHKQTTVTQSYDPAYVAIDYPGGDVPLATGVCTDVVIRAFRAAGADLQQRVHEDMRQAFGDYPQEWGLQGPDTNIDHRRVPNLMRYFERQGKSLPVSRNAADYQPGDVVTWDLGGGNWHTGVVSNVRLSGTGRLAIIHNIGSGTRQEDVLFAWKILGHYRYF